MNHISHRHHLCGRLLSAADYAARRHRDQRRKGPTAIPYINHPLEVAMLLATVGKIDDPEILAAALLHDILEDTDTRPDALRRQFGRRVLALVKEVTDDKRLPRAERFRRQIAHAPHLSRAAQQIKLADKISNVGDIATDPPVGWTAARRWRYLEVAARVAAGVRGCNPALERLFARTLRQSRRGHLARR